MGISAVRDAGLTQVTDVIEILLNLLIAPRKIQSYLRHVMQTTAGAGAAPDVVDLEPAGFPLLPHLNERFRRCILRIGREAYPLDAELLQIQQVFRRGLTRA